jgi:hypothetical protein
MNPVKRLMSWLRGPSDPESLTATAEARRLGARRDTIRISQNTSATQSANPNPILAAPTPDVLDPGSEDSHKEG